MAFVNFVFLLAVFVSNHIISGDDLPDFVLVCPTNLTITNRDYETSLDHVLTYLSSNATDKEFYKATDMLNGHDNTTLEKVYGLFMCRAGVVREPCGKCVLKAIQQLRTRCSTVKEAIIWHDVCVIRYSNRSFFSMVEIRPRHYQSVSLFIHNSYLTGGWESAVNKAAARAANTAVNGMKYATTEVTIMSVMYRNPYPLKMNAYYLVQCTPDLSSKDCYKCLIVAIQDVANASEARGVAYPSCYVTYAEQPFLPHPPAPAPALIAVGSAPTPAPAGVNYPMMPTPTELSNPSEGRRRTTGELRMAIVVLIPVAILIMLFCLGCYFLRRKAKRNHKAILKENWDEIASLESLQFDLATIEAATNKFSYENRIGKGGFGEVYKGILLDGREIAVKRLSRNSTQGAQEFKNEILLIAKLQHRNLVALLGFCLHGQEKILIYEFVPNKSLDYFLFDSQNHRLLNWHECYKIIGGIAQAILYLHQHSRLKVIHRDLKPSNVLLDNNMNPKISDFGMAKMIALDEDKGSTMRIVGTYGYMSPEHAMLGQFSEKSDVFSFGVMILEIISGKRNSTSYESDEVVGLLNYAWRKWKDQTPLDILDSNIKESYTESQVIRCIQIGLLCVQESPDDRLTMMLVHSCVNNLLVELPFPREPAFYMHGRMEPNMIAIDIGQSTNNAILSVNEMSISNSLPR